MGVGGIAQWCSSTTRCRRVCPSPALAQHVRNGADRQKKAGKRCPSSIIRLGFLILTIGLAVPIPIGPPRRIWSGPAGPADCSPGAILLVRLSISFAARTEARAVLPPANQQRVPHVLEENERFTSNTARTAALSTNPRRYGTRSSAAIRTPGRSPFRCTAHSHARRAHRAVQLVAHDAHTRSHTIRLR
jgi:hypothetical protein